MQCFQKSYFHQHCNTFACACHATRGGQGQCPELRCQVDRGVLYVPQNSPNYGGWRSTLPATCRCTQVLPAKAGALPGPRESCPRESCPGAPPEVSPPGRPCQPWGHAPPGSTKQLQCRRGSGSPVYGRSTHWTPSQRTGADRRGCVRWRTSEYLFRPPQAASLPGARLSASRVLQQDRKHGSTSQALVSSSSAAAIDSLFGLTHSFNLSVPSSLPGKGQGSWICLAGRL